MSLLYRVARQVDMPLPPKSPNQSTPQNASAPRSMRRILIVRLSAHGDLVQTLPLLADLKQHPDTQVGWLVEASAAPLLANHPELDYLHIAHRKDWLNQLKARPWCLFSILREVFSLIQEIRAVGYDYSMDVQGLLKSAVWPFLCGIPTRMGYKNTRESADVFYNQPIPPHDMRDANTPTILKFRDFAHQLDQTPNTVETIRFPLAPIPPEQEQTVSTLLADCMPEHPLLVIAPTTIWASKQWPTAHWVKLLTALQDLPLNIGLIGAPNDMPTIEHLLETLPPNPSSVARYFNWCGQTRLPDLIALFHHADYFIGLDSASLHIANAVASNSSNGRPHIIGLYGPTAPGRTGPIGDQHVTVHTNLPCQPCFKRECPLQTDACMDELLPEQVVQMIKTRLQ